MSIHPGPFHPLNAESFAAMCEGKAPFASPKQAHKVAKRRRHTCDVYHCPHCGFFHLGTPMTVRGKGPIEPKPRRKIRNRNGVRRMLR